MFAQEQIPLNIFTEDIFIINQDYVPPPDTEKKSTIAEKEPVEKISEKKYSEFVVFFSENNTSAEIELLNKILTAISVDKAKVTEEVYTKENLDLVLKQTKTERILIFTGEAEQMLGKRKYEIFSLGLTKLIISDSLSVLNSNIENKKALWKVLQLFINK